MHVFPVCVCVCVCVFLHMAQKEGEREKREWKSKYGNKKITSVFFEKRAVPMLTNQHQNYHY